MSSLLLYKAPQCLSCLRQAAGAYGATAALVQQTRGSKQLAKKLANILHKTNAILLRNTQTGKRGNVISATSGRMRNRWFPRGQAAYVTDATMEKFGLKQVDITALDDAENKKKQEKKTSFDVVKEVYWTEKLKRMEMSDLNRKGKLRRQRRRLRAGLPAKRPKKLVNAAKVKVADPVYEEVPQKVEVKTLSPMASALIVATVLPPNLEFYRQPNASVETPTPKKISPSLKSKAAIADAAKAFQKPAKAEKTPIFGSVSTLDIAESMKAVLAEDEDGKRVVLSPEDITFVGLAELEEKDRVKHLGIFEVDIRLKGAPDAVRRTIKVSATA